MRTLNAICPYFTMFPLDFPLSRLEGAAGAVYDPFCGRGTTALAAGMLGLESHSCDTNQTAVAITRSKLSDASPETVVALCGEILATVAPDPVPEGEFWSLCFAPGVLDAVLRLRAGLRDSRDPASDALLGCVLGSLHGPRRKSGHTYLSNQMPRTFAAKPDYLCRYWKRNGLVPDEIDVLPLLATKVRRTFSDIPPRAIATVTLGDSRVFAPPHDTIGAVVTSPPYFGMKTYVTDQWLRNWFCGGPARPDYSAAGQIAMGSPADFAIELSKVWNRTAQSCRDGATMTVRFGGLRSRRSDPLSLLRESILGCGAGWRIVSEQSASHSSDGNRQAEQMGDKARCGLPVEEWDVACRLLG
jgi:hypothetical protein